MLCGPNGVCVGCTTDSQCSGATPVCNTTNGTCVQCDSANTTQCSGSTPVCDTNTLTCVSCNGDNGSMATERRVPHFTTQLRSASSQRWLDVQGQCGKCMTNADCTGHTGNVCDTGSGLCVNGCLKDTDCMTGNRIATRPRRER